MTRSERRIRTLAGIGVCGLLAVVFGGAKAETPQLQIHSPAGDSKEAVQFSPGEIDLKPVEGKPGVYAANVIGNPGVAGVYVVFVKMDNGATNAPHTHPDGRATTVITGKVLYGLGDRIDPSSAKVYGPGSFYYTPPNTPHYLVATEGEVLYQEVGMGPSASIPVQSK